MVKCQSALAAVVVSVSLFYNIVIFVLSYLVCTGSGFCQMTYAFRFPNNNHTGWDCFGGYPSESLCLPWTGVDCVNGEVTSISLAHRSLIGSIPSGLGLLSSLTYLDFSANKLNGTIPSAIGLMSQLSSLNLDHNHFTGAVPTSLSFLSNLTRISLSYNSINGTLPSILGTIVKLRYLDVAHTRLTGSLPSSLCSDGLTYLAIYNSTLSCYSYCFSTVVSKNFGGVPQCANISNGTYLIFCFYGLKLSI